MTDVHTKRELEAFNAYTKAMGWLQSGVRAEKRDPPEPDLLVQDPDGRCIAIEVVEILGEDYGGMLGLLFGTKTALYSHFDGLPPDRKAKFQDKFSNALLYFRYTEYSTMRQRKQKIPMAFDRLLDLPEGFVGEALAGEPDLLPTLKSVSVARAEFNGPVFDPESVWMGFKKILHRCLATSFKVTPSISVGFIHRHDSWADLN